MGLKRGTILKTAFETYEVEGQLGSGGAGTVYSAKIFSYTRRELTHITVTARYIEPGDTVLIIDDFLAHGEALQGLVSIVHQAGAKLAGAGIVIEKRFQHGGDALRAEGVRIESLAVIDRMEPGVIHFA